MHDAVDRLVARGLPSAPGKRPTTRSVPGPSKWSASNPAAASRRARSSSSSARVAQAATGSGSSSRQTWAISPQSRSSASPGEVRIDEARPRGRRAGDHRPVDEPLVDDGQHLLDERQLVAARALGVEAVESVGGAGPASEIRAARCRAEREHPVAEPAGHEVERLLVARARSARASRTGRSTSTSTKRAPCR